jgi:hypothetical protein
VTATSIPPSPSVSIGGVRSETGRLHRVLVHRPGRELDRLTPANAPDLFFDDVVWPQLAREEGDILVATPGAVSAAIGDRRRRPGCLRRLKFEGRARGEPPPHG